MLTERGPLQSKPASTTSWCLRLMVVSLLLKWKKKKSPQPWSIMWENHRLQSKCEPKSIPIVKIKCWRQCAHVIHMNETQAPLVWICIDFFFVFWRCLHGYDGDPGFVFTNCGSACIFICVGSQSSEAQHGATFLSWLAYYRSSCLCLCGLILEKYNDYQDRTVCLFLNGVHLFPFHFCI